MAVVIHSSRDATLMTYQQEWHFGCSANRSQACGGVVGVREVSLKTPVPVLPCILGVYVFDLPSEGGEQCHAACGPQEVTDGDV